MVSFHLKLSKRNNLMVFISLNFHEKESGRLSSLFFHSFFLLVVVVVVGFLGHISGHKPAFWLAVFLSVVSGLGGDDTGHKTGPLLGPLSRPDSLPLGSQVQLWGWWGKAWAVESGCLPLPLYQVLDLKQWCCKTEFYSLLHKMGKLRFSTA